MNSKPLQAKNVQKVRNQLVPTTIITGFLGSGKTTLILHLLDDLLKLGVKPVYIKNEIGAADVDGALVRGKHIQTKELLNGCICCTLVGPFQSAIDELLEVTDADRLIIEASGAADPAAIALMVSSHPRLLRDGVVSVVDVLNFEGYKDLSQTARNQTIFTDIIVFNKIEDVSLDRKRQVVGYVRELNAHSPIIEAPNGRANPAILLGLDGTELRKLLQHSPQATEDHAHNHTALHLQQDGIEVLKIATSQVVVTDKTEQIIAALPNNVFRVKGFMVDAQGQLHAIQKVGARVSVAQIDLSPMPDLELVLIGFHLSDSGANLGATLIKQLAS